MIRPKEHLKHIFRSPSVQKTRMDCLRMDKNEFLPCWPSDWFADFLSQVRPEHISIHPELTTLYQKLGAILNVPRENIVVTAGSDAAIRTAFEVFVEPGDEVVIPSPTFAMYYVYGRIFNASLVEIHYDEDLSLDLQRVLDAITSRTKLVAIANPNSPTGTIIEHEQLQQIIKKASDVGAVVLIDEAYHPFYEQSVLDLVSAYDNLIVTRTFSKAAGMAGMRTGCLISNAEIAKLAFAVKPMYEVTTISVLLAEYVLDHYERVFSYARQVQAGKYFLANYFTQNGFEIYSGHANFLHVNFGNRKKEIVSYLAKRNVLFKDYFEHPSLKKYSRFTVGPKDVMESFTSIFDAYVDGSAL